MGDISQRAIEVMRECDYLLVEDTRQSGKLLKAHRIETPMKSFHKFSERSLHERVVGDIESGLKVGLMSDAGLPGICDPGCALIREVEATIVPGPCAFACAAALCGVGDRPLQFLGYPPEKKWREALLAARRYEGISIFYVAPHDLKRILGACHDWRVWVVRELTKVFEEVVCGRADEIEVTAKGEMVLLIEGEGRAPLVEVMALVERLEKMGARPREAIRFAAEMSGRPQKEIYQQCLSKKKKID
ncbi:MAG: SAM-dependent methyltransferase [Simkaniaceae bacterium]|nr:SAM-dependent methyltransferase [Simkaniaceae bacterium]